MLYTLAWARGLRGRPIDDLRARFKSASSAAALVTSCPERVEGQRHVWRGELEQARTVLMPELTRADEQGKPSSYALLRLHLCELELRAGEWEAAGRLLDEWGEPSERELLLADVRALPRAPCRRPRPCGRGRSGGAAP